MVQLSDNVENLDRILNDLEELARSDVESSRFFALATERAAVVFQAGEAGVLLPVGAGSWVPIASVSDVSRLSQGIEDRLNASASPPKSLQAEDLSWIAVPLRAQDFNKGCFVVEFNRPIPRSEVPAMIELLDAFAEIIAIRQTMELEHFLDHDWNQLQALCRRLATASRREEAYTLLAHGLCSIVSATRASILTRAGSRTTLGAITGAPNATRSSQTVQALCEVASATIKHAKPILHHSEPSSDDGEPLLSPDGTFANLLCTPFEASPTGPSKDAVCLEFQSYPELIQALNKLTLILPTISIAWQQQDRVLAMPKWLRTVTSGMRLSKFSGLIKWACLAGCLLGALWLGTRPYPLVIEAEGSYEPVHRRTVFATKDGFVDQLLVRDGQEVALNEPLMQLRSPELELAIQQLRGESRTVAEELASLNIAMNQLDPGAADLNVSQSRMASRIAQLETKQLSLRDQQELLESEKDRLILRAPIAGFVVAQDAEQHLRQRPVRQGDALLSIMDLTGPWQIRVQVADSDSAYVRSYYDSSDENVSEANVDFVVDSAPDMRHSAAITWIADHVENIHGEGCSLELRARTTKAGLENVHSGAGVHAYFQCGKQQFWFVWCRPLIEAAQRRMWFRSNDSNG